MPSRSRIPLIAAFALLGASAAFGADRPRVETIGLDSVSALALDEQRRQLFIETSGKIEAWALSPLRLLGVTPMHNPEIPDAETIVADLEVSPAGRLYASGRSWNRDDLQLLGGSVVGFDIASPGDLERFSVYEVPADRAITYPVVSQFGDMAFDGDGNVYFSSPVESSVMIRPDGPDEIEQVTEYMNIELACGPSAQISVTDFGDAAFYVSSTANGAMIEIGALADPSGRTAKGKRGDAPDCFRVANVFAFDEEPATVNAVAHAFVEMPGGAGGPDAGRVMLALEPNTNRLTLFPVRLEGGIPAVSRKGSVEVLLSETAGEAARDRAVYTMLRASADGSTILVAGRSVDHVLRFSIDGGELRFRGMLGFGGPVQALALSPDGATAAIAAREAGPDGVDRLHVIEGVDLLRDGEQLPPVSNETVESLQQLLNSAGYEAGSVDGLIGQRTETAARSFLIDVLSKTQDAGAVSMASGAVSVMMEVADRTDDTTEERDIIELTRFAIGTFPSALGAAEAALGAGPE